MILFSRIGLGTVQFGQDYGIANKGGKIPPAEVFDILKKAGDLGIHVLDTASTYGDSETVIGGFIKKNKYLFRVVSKFFLDSYQQGGLKRSLEQTLTKLNTPSIYGYLAHRLNDVLDNQGLWEEMQELKQQNLVQKIGFSIYSPSELEALNKRHIKFDIIQFPYSILDLRFEPYMQGLKEQNVEIHTRSVFLQGLVFMNSDQLPVHFKDVGKQLKSLREIAVKQGVSIQSLCLNYALLNPHIDRVIIGVDGLRHFEDNLKCLEDADRIRSMYDQLQELSIDNEEVLLPNRWPR